MFHRIQTRIAQADPMVAQALLGMVKTLLCQFLNVLYVEGMR